MPYTDHPDNILGVNTNNNLFDSSNVAANADGSMIERQEYIQGKIGIETDFWGSKYTILGYSNAAYQHIHSPAKCYPTLANGVTVTGAAGAWALGNFAEIIPAGTITTEFDIHWVNFEAVSANDVYEFVLYAGGAGAETEIGRVRTYKTSTAAGSISVAIQIPPQPANTRISAKVASSSGNDNVTVSLFYHEYS
jgi:hypothetical protein